MALRKGSTKSAIRANIKELMKKHPHKKAVKMALEHSKGGKKINKMSARQQAALRLRKGMKA